MNMIEARAARVVAIGAALALGVVSTVAAATPLPRSASDPAHVLAWDRDGGMRAHDRGWGHHHDGIDGGDILAGVLILGGIAAIAGIASSASKTRTAQAPANAPPPAPRDGYVAQAPGGAAQGSADRALDAAVNACAGEAGRQGDVDTIDDARAESGGVRVEGGLSSGRRFTCQVDGSGRVRDLQFHDRG